MSEHKQVILANYNDHSSNLPDLSVREDRTASLTVNTAPHIVLDGKVTRSSMSEVAAAQFVRDIVNKVLDRRSYQGHDLPVDMLSREVTKWFTLNAAYDPNAEMIVLKTSPASADTSISWDDAFKSVDVETGTAGDFYDSVTKASPHIRERKAKLGCRTILSLKYDKNSDSYVFSIKPTVTFQEGEKHPQVFRVPDAAASEIIKEACRLQLESLFSSEEEDYFQLAVLTGQLDHLRNSLDSACADTLIGRDLSHLRDVQQYSNVAKAPKYDLKIPTDQERNRIHEDYVSEEAKKAIDLLFPETSFCGGTITASDQSKKTLLQKMIDEMEEKRPEGMTTATWSHVLSTSAREAYEQMKAKAEPLEVLLKGHLSPESSTDVRFASEEETDNLITNVTLAVRYPDAATSSSEATATSEDGSVKISFEVML